MKVPSNEGKCHLASSVAYLVLYECKGSLVVRSFVRTKLMEYLRGLPSFVIPSKVIRYEGILYLRTN